MTFNLRHALILGLSLVGPTAVAWADVPATKLRADSDMVCGPRCVKFILRSYGQEVDLIELVKEIQWPDLEAGASLDRIERSLNVRGIYTKAVRFAPDRRLTWPHPAVLFTDEGNPPSGHYVVTSPEAESGSDDLIWAGVEGWRRGRWNEITRGFAGVALLTSPEPIPEAVMVADHVAASKLFQIAGLACGGVILAHLLVRVAARRSFGSRLGASVSPH